MAKRALKDLRIDLEAGVIRDASGRRIDTHHTSGYRRVMVDGRYRPAHRVIWESVHGPIPAALEINHMNAVKADNRIANLEVVTPSGNVQHAYDMGLRSAVGTQNGRAKVTEATVVAIRSDQRTITTLAKLHGISRRQVRSIRTREYWRHIP